MSDTTRRAFVKKSATAAAGMTVVGGLLAEEAEAKKAKKAVHGKKGPIVAYIHKPANGEVIVMHGKKQVQVRDHKLAAQIAKHAR